ncbi:Aps1p [Cyberlindnera jadinii NRRL Y-1542]|uniref:AP complex subunit sigma n=1 Tax=Cyberlindnera jadinii (strain ATCC 18201 / CBS 1600 / BCRC 20928 / JCM 3617 / NBRC 0987 / NRRL Y-1542) TaxID=983966 RepID=A0A1E4S904_CYBJN|nr:AP-1 clathrin associated protein complex subunit [Cyberlindnera jadinii NRRL Y-1542]ODV75995.1 AP-1 clathrin associated protein complex subunit [Cyberlindnera jadinii NRRL Y-1542]
MKYLIVLSRQGKIRLSKWYVPLSQKDKAKITRELTALVLGRKAKMCNISEYKDSKIVYRRYASLFFIAGVDNEENELLTLDIIHRFVEQMDKAYGNVCELDIIFNFQKAYHILDELLIGGDIVESSKREALRRVGQQDQFESLDQLDSVIA